MTESITISIIIVNWNGKENLLNCLDSLFKIKSRYKYKIVIIDNGSVDDSVVEIEKIQKKKKNLILIKSKTNLGYAGGNNVGMRYAKDDIIVLLNNDTFVESNFLDPLVDELVNDDTIAGIQPRIMNYPRTKIVDSVGSYFISTGFLYHIGHNKKIRRHKFNTLTDVFTMKGACMAFKKKVLDKVGLFDDSYFAYFEETDLCQRMLLAGYRICYTPSSTIYHIGGETSKHLASSFVQYHSYKNRIRTYLKNFELLTLIKILPTHLLLCEIVSLVYLVTFKFSLSFSIQKAIFWNIKYLHTLRKNRRKISKIRLLKDYEYLNKISRSVRPQYYYHLFTTALAGYND